MPTSSTAPPAITISPDDYTGGYPLETASKALLAQGDSWFSIGALPPWRTTNLLFGLKLAQSTTIVNCAKPGAVLTHMTDTTTDTKFLQILNGPLSMKFDAILLSGGGNDMIDAVQSTHDSPEKRLLLRASEWGQPVAGAARYISEEGWSTFEGHMEDVFTRFIAARDKAASKNRHTPVVFHTYDRPTPRDASAGFGFGPWLCKAFTAFAIPPHDWHDVSVELFERLRVMLVRLGQQFPNMHLVDTQGTLAPAAASDAGASTDWQNEIHPTRSGYKQLAAKWVPVIEAVY
ncbi:GDSL-type esterase/lipase family protein [Caenimonas koreensis]|uniref:GDSL-like Lipase/Acylhydrolase family protein n=1 Tax=Caenimonas koreensis DSM 17982 TaxID=1121255 RepID=A0A844AVA6_9BURK|nr:GDSL-type esterase/lipase family protein [Caenimonas koreensis]MRD48450.1 hypothetical protein [Caenimonas koreensis DSM 17982]